ncbi:MAG: hypothetical protein K0B14_10375 [Anaerolineaceae bacterium]|nr:hypothetical protein [Anaerolineaceae bacterium]
MTTNTNSTINRRWILFLIGVLVSCFLISICIGVIGLVPYFNISDSNASPIHEVPDVTIKLRVDNDGCGVIRGEIQGDTEVSSLTWVIQDEDGYSVLERNAENEYQYSYFVSGTYTVHIKAWYAGAYHPISDLVTIDCK